MLKNKKTIFTAVITALFVLSVCYFALLAPTTAWFYQEDTDAYNYKFSFKRFSETVTQVSTISETLPLRAATRFADSGEWLFDEVAHVVRVQTTNTDTADVDDLVGIVHVSVDLKQNGNAVTNGIRWFAFADNAALTFPRTVPLTPPVYVAARSTDEGALLIVANDVTPASGQIRLANVTPTANGYTPAVNGYTKKDTNWSQQGDCKLHIESMLQDMGVTLHDYKDDSALLIVANDVTPASGQIQLSNVTPTASGFTPAVGGYTAVGYSSKYVAAQSTDQGALLIVANDATPASGQIRLANVTPTASGFTPAVGGYTAVGYFSEYVAAQSSNDGETTYETYNTLYATPALNADHSRGFVVEPGESKYIYVVFWAEYGDLETSIQQQGTAWTSDTYTADITVSASPYIGKYVKTTNNVTSTPSYSTQYYSLSFQGTAFDAGNITLYYGNDTTGVALPSGATSVDVPDGTQLRVVTSSGRIAASNGQIGVVTGTGSNVCSVANMSGPLTLTISASS